MQYFVEIEARSKFIFSGRSGVNTTCIILTIQTITANAQIPIVDTIIARIGAGDVRNRSVTSKCNKLSLGESEKEENILSLELDC